MGMMLVRVVPRSSPSPTSLHLCLSSTPSLQLRTSPRALHTSSLLTSKRYTKRHEWAEVTGSGQARVGLTQYAAQALGDVVYAELPEEGRQVARGEEVGAVESVKAAREVYSPLTGKVLEANGEVEEKPGLVSSSPEGRGWLFSLEVEEAGEVEAMMDLQQYTDYLRSQEDDLE